MNEAIRSNKNGCESIGDEKSIEPIINALLSGDTSSKPTLLQALKQYMPRKTPEGIISDLWDTIVNLSEKLENTPKSVSWRREIANILLNATDEKHK